MKYAVTIGQQEFVVEIQASGQVIVDGQPYEIDMASIDGAPALSRSGAGSLLSLLIDNKSYEVFIERQEQDYRVMLGGEMYVVNVEDERLRRLQELGGHQASVSGEVVVKAPMPGLVVSVPVAPGQMVEMGQPVVILEAMKMENQIRAPRTGMVRAVRVSSGEVVNLGQIMVVLE
ncbi:MAG: biotin/lipoyl-binding protein [Chloroflexi bacterium]|nr:biotin/lipoyl-binding protein [Chloroflexota bacterium]